MKSGGRQKGTPNKRTLLDVAANLAYAHVNPIMKLIEIADHKDASLELQTKIYAELAKYVAPQLKAIDHSSEDGTTSTGVHEIVVRVVKPAPHEEEPVVIATDKEPSTNITRLSH